MKDKPGAPRRCFHMHETARMQALEGLALAAFWQRLLGFLIDLLLAVLVWIPLELSVRRYLLHQGELELTWNFHEPGNIVVMVLYWAVCNYVGNGQTPGKWAARTKAMSLTSDRLGVWQSVERALGYGAAVLEAGLGFVQFFWDRNRMCAQDRRAETIVVDIRKRSKDLDASAV
jgi:uncharacterized RDD family membrane protein YckC